MSRRTVIADRRRSRQLASSSLAASMRKSSVSSANCVPWTKNAPTFVSTGRTRLDVERPTNPRSLQPFHAPGTSRLSTNTPKINQGTTPEFGKVESSLAHLTRSPRVVSIPRPVRFLLHFRLAGREAWTCGESSKRHMRTSSLG